ncbi:trypsin-like serine peptidase [Rhodopirellula baltica]|uniref:Glutamyl endopeptidase n=1 Tax=Rhodopirellula baltica SWK14 TaxID=993516 RepID=L7C7G8_RHOBT|nr:glutamyl endopeptidase [Rhodopirellula baltica SWK14]
MYSMGVDGMISKVLTFESDAKVALSLVDAEDARQSIDRNDSQGFARMAHRSFKIAPPSIRQINPIPGLQSVPDDYVPPEHAESLEQSLDGGSFADPNILVTTEFPDPRTLFAQSTLIHASTSRVADVTQTPYNAVGKLTFRTPGGGFAQGSAWGCGRQTIATVAHNLYGRGLSSEVEFFPGLDVYRNATPTGYRVTSVQFHPNYRSNATNADIAICRLATPLPNSITPLPLAVTDHFAFDANQFITVAYPGHAAFDFAQTPWECRGKFLFSERGDSTRQHCPVKASTLGPGCSGGPWLTRASSGWLAVGVCSGPSSEFYNPGKRLIASTKSPIFDAQTLDALDRITQRFTFS